MVRLLEKESFDQITTVELAQESGISRSSFYTHYRDKYDMIERYQQALFHKLEYIFDKHQDDKRQAITEVFEFLTKEPLFAVLLTENGTKEIQTFLRHKLQILLVDSLQERYSHKSLTDIERVYSSVYLTNAFVYWDDVEDLIITDGKIDAAYVQEGYKEALTYMNRLVSEGLLAPETFTITEGQYREYLSTETPTVGVCFYTHLGFVGPTDENKNQYQYMPYLIGADGKQRVSYQPYDISVMSHCYIPTSAKDPDLSFDFINWLFSEETYVRARFGVEGVHYDKVDDPETLELLKSNHPFAIMEYDNGWGESNNMSWQNSFGYFTGSSWMCQWNGDPNYYFYKRVVAVDDMMSKVPGVGEYVPSLTYTAEETEQYNELKNNISTFWKEYRTRFILGELNIETEWQSYLDTLYNDLHLEDYLAIVQGAYDRQFGA